MSLDRWKLLREVERYQLKIAEEYYIKKEWKIAADEYEKYLTLYEDSEAASFSLLKWGLCQLHLRKQNTAVSEGFQSVVDYWPDSPDAIAAAYFIGQTYKNVGEPKKAKAAYAEVLKNHPEHLVAVYALHDLIEISKVEGDLDTRVMLWKKLAFETPRDRESQSFCVRAAQDLAQHQFRQAAFAEGVKTLETTYKDQELTRFVVGYTRSQAAQLTGDAETKPTADRLVDQAIGWLKTRDTNDISTEPAEQAAKDVWFAVVDLHASVGRHNDIPGIFSRIEQRFGADDDVLGKLADWQKSQDKYDEARATYNRYKNQVEGKSQIAYSFRQQGNYEQAARAYLQVVAIDPQNPVRWKPEVARNYRDANKHDPAIAVYRELIVDDAKSPDRWQMEIARTLRDAGKYPDAIQQYNACENFPQNYLEIADCYRRMKKWEEAIRTYAQVISAPEGASSAPSATLQIGYCYEHAGNKEAAIKAFQQVCKKYPKDSHASVAHARLQTDYGITVTFGGGKDE